MIDNHMHKKHITEAERLIRFSKFRSDFSRGKHIKINSDTIPVSLVRMPRPKGKIYKGETSSMNTENNKGPVLTKKYK